MALRRRTAFSLALAVLLLSCGDSIEDSRGTKPLVVTTVAPITDLVRRVAGDRADVVGLVPDGVDSHTFEPAPRDAALLSEADLLLANGLFLEEPSLRLAEANLPDGAPVVTLADQVITEDEWVFDRSFPREQGIPNPHLWLDVRHAIAYVDLIAGALVDVDPDGWEDYEARRAVVVGELAALDTAIAEAVGTIPPARRRLVTYHDSWPYFGRRYGLEVISAIQPSDFAEPSAAEVRRIIDQLRATPVPAIFGSEVFPSDVLRAIAAETGAAYVDDLSDDELPGEVGDPEHSYVGMMVRNVRIMVDSLGGDSSALDRVDPTRRGQRPDG